MIEDIWKIGSDRILKANYKRVRNDARERKERKQRLNRAVVKKVNENNLRQGANFKPEHNVPLPPWTQKMKEILPDMY